MFMLTGLLFGDAAESIFPVEKLYDLQCFGENETAAEKYTLRGRKIYLDYDEY